MGDASVSVITVNWNHGRLLGECLEALMAQAYPRFDVTIVDNGSVDGSLDQIESRFPETQVVRFAENRGFSAAFNVAVQRTEGEFVLSLNPDVVVRPGFLSELVRAADQNGRIGIAAPKLLQASDPRILDSTGLFVSRSRRPYDRGQGERDRGQFDSARFVFGASGAAALFRRSMLESLLMGGEYFDEDFFTYYEDADLAWRAQLQGWQCIYEPRATATHDRGWGDTLLKRGRARKDSTGPRLAMRNRYLMTVKNDAVSHILADLPLIVGAELPRLAYAAVTRPRVLLGLTDLVRMWPQAMAKRQSIRNGRDIADATVRRWFLAPAELAAG